MTELPTSQPRGQTVNWMLEPRTARSSAGRRGRTSEVRRRIPRPSCSTEVEEAASILENAPTLSTQRANLHECIAALFVFASKSVLLRDLNVESVWEQRAAICLEALYFLSLAIKKAPQRVADLDNRLVVAAFSPILQSVRSWLIVICHLRASRPIHKRQLAHILKTRLLGAPCNPTIRLIDPTFKITK